MDGSRGLKILVSAVRFCPETQGNTENVGENANGASPESSGPSTVSTGTGTQSAQPIAQIRLTNGLIALVDVEDVERVRGYAWRSEVRPNGVTYVRAMITITRGRGGKRVPLYLHRFVAGAAKGQVVDHVDFDGLNNTKANLRICSTRDNTQHRRGVGGRWPKGVRLSSKGRWAARIVAPAPEGGSGNELSLGTYPTRELAARGYDLAALRLFGDFAHTNYPRVEYTPELIEAVRTARARPASARQLRGEYRGVWPHGKKWGASICANGKQIYLGLFDDPIEAAKAYDREARAHFGEFACCNFAVEEERVSA